MRHAGGSFGSRRGGSCHARNGAARRPFAAAVARILPRSRILASVGSRAVPPREPPGSVGQGRPGRPKTHMPARPRGPTPAPGRGPPAAVPRDSTPTTGKQLARVSRRSGRLRLGQIEHGWRVAPVAKWRLEARDGTYQHPGANPEPEAPETRCNSTGAHIRGRGAAEATYRHSLHPSSAANAARRYNPGRCRIPSSS